MSKIKIKELSEKMSLDVKEILAKCKELSIVARTQSSSISLEDAKKIQISLVGEPILKKPKTDNEIIKRSGSKVTIRRKKRPEPIKKESSNLKFCFPNKAVALFIAVVTRLPILISLAA